MDNSIYEVTRSDYASFIRTIKPECREVQTVQEGNYIICNVYSVATKTLLCARKAHNIEDEEKREPERYYIFNLPTAEESLPLTPVAKIELKTREEIQSFLNYFAKMQKENKNNG